MGLDRVELSTSRLSGVRSNHLSYRPLGRVAKGIQPWDSSQPIMPPKPSEPIHMGNRNCPRGVRPFARSDVLMCATDEVFEGAFPCILPRRRRIPTPLTIVPACWMALEAPS